MSDLSDWIGRHDELTETIGPVPVKLLAATLDLPTPAIEPGDPIPPIWHWLYFLPDADQRELGVDGHPRRGIFYPDVPLRRRMFAAGQMTIHRPLRLGESATRRRQIVEVEEKQGSTGPLVLVQVRHDIEGEDGPAVTEHQTIVYTDSPPAHAPIDGSPPAATWERDVPTDPALLFRFSALTFNSHRIHYDHPYATEEEGYQGIVVHGPLILMLLAELARQEGIDATGMRFRARSPLFCGDTVHLRGDRDNGIANVRAYRGAELAMDALIS